MHLDWEEIEDGLWQSSIEGLHFIIEETRNGVTGETLYQASQVLRTCSATFEHRIRRFPTLDEAKSFLEEVADIQLGIRKRAP